MEYFQRIASPLPDAQTILQFEFGGAAPHVVIRPLGNRGRTTVPHSAYKMTRTQKHENCKWHDTFSSYVFASWVVRVRKSKTMLPEMFCFAGRKER